MLLYAAERYVYGVGATSAADAPNGSRSATRDAAWLVELTRHVVRCERVGLAATRAGPGRLRPLATSGVAEEDSKAWWRVVRRAQTKHRRLDPAQVPPLDGDHISLGVVSWQASASARHTRDMGERSLLFAPVRTGGYLVAVLVVDGVDGADLTLPQSILLARAFARLAGCVLDEELRRS